MLTLNKDSLKQHPLAKSLLVYPKRKLQMLSSELLVFSRLRYWLNPHIPPESSVFWIDPQSITWHTNADSCVNTPFRNRTFDMFWDKGKILGGDWDDKKFKFKDLTVYEAIQSRITHAVAWQDTPFFAECIDDIYAGRTLWKCRDESSLLKRLEDVDQIIRDMQLNGYKPGHVSRLQNEDMSAVAKHRKHSEEITINIGRSGEFFFQDGRHRLAIAIALGIEKVPVKVLVRHSKWCKNLKTITLGEAKQQSLLDHPDIQYQLQSGRILND